MHSMRVRCRIATKTLNLTRGWDEMMRGFNCALIFSSLCFLCYLKQHAHTCIHIHAHIHIYMYTHIHAYIQEMNLSDFLSIKYNFIMQKSISSYGIFLSPSDLQEGIDVIKFLSLLQGLRFQGRDKADSMQYSRHAILTTCILRRLLGISINLYYFDTMY